MFSPTLCDTNLEYDDKSWDQGTQIYDTWKSKLLKRDNLLKIGKLIDTYKGGVTDSLSAPQKERPWKDRTRGCCDAVSYVDKTNIPLPLVLHSGTAEESPGGLGPFIITEYVEHECDLVDALNTPDIPCEERPILHPDIPHERPHFIDGQMADIMLQYSMHTFPKIGCISSLDDGDTWVVSHRPLTLNMNELVWLGNVSPDLLPQGPFETSTSYYIALADMHLAHLKAQRAEVMQRQDFRCKYIARRLCCKMARVGLLSQHGDKGPFSLFNDDFRPANVLDTSKFEVTRALDWEFTYAASPEFAHSAPVWLLLELPEYWPEGLDDWMRVYEKNLPVFLAAISERETAAIKHGILKEHQRLSQFIDDSWRTGDFWASYAARRCWAFDMIYWAKIDRSFFGDGTLDDRYDLLTLAERQELDQLVDEMTKAGHETRAA